MEENEGVIEDWYFNQNGKETLIQYLCQDKALKGQDSKCLFEQLKGDPGKTKSSKKEL